MKSWKCPGCGESVHENDPWWSRGDGTVYHRKCKPHTEQPAPNPTSGDPTYLRLLDELRALHIRKAADYGRGNDPLANIKASEQIGIPAWKAAWLRAKDKVHRIDTFCLNGKLANEGVEDSFKD